MAVIGTDWACLCTLACVYLSSYVKTNNVARSDIYTRTLALIHECFQLMALLQPARHTHSGGGGQLKPNET